MDSRGFSADISGHILVDLTKYTKPGRKIAKQQRKGADALDAPVSGGT